MNQKSRELAQEFLESNQDSYDISFPITLEGQQTSEEVVIIVKKIRKSYVKSFTETVKRYIPSASGGQCPTCNGTGRV